jgi:hypothetical protein
MLSGAKNMEAKDHEALLAALKSAADLGSEEVVELLLSARWARSDECVKILAMAYAENANVGALGRLLSKRADWATLLSDGEAMLAAASGNSGACAVALMAAGVGVDGNVSLLDSPLGCAASTGKLDFVEKVLAAGADANGVHRYGWTALHRVASYGGSGHKGVGKHGGVKCAEALLAGGAHADAKTLKGETPLMLSMVENLWKIAKMLIKAGADIDDRDVAGRTPLMWAAMHGSQEGAALLMKGGCDLDAVAADGDNAEAIARAYGEEPCAQLIAAERARREKAALASTIKNARTSRKAGRAKSL